MEMRLHSNWTARVPLCSKWSLLQNRLRRFSFLGRLLRTPRDRCGQTSNMVSFRLLDVSGEPGSEQDVGVLLPDDTAIERDES